MPFETLGKNMMLNALRGTAPGTPLTHAGLLQAGGAKSVTGVAATGVFTSAAHGYSNGDLVVFSAITGGTGLTTGYPYFVVSTATNTFQVALTPGGAAVIFGADLTAGTVKKLTEVTGGSPTYARKAVTYAVAADGAINLSAPQTFDIPAGTTVDWVRFFSAVTAGTGLGITAVVAETFAGQGTYTLNTSAIDLNL